MRMVPTELVFFEVTTDVIAGPKGHSEYGWALDTTVTKAISIFTAKNCNR